jgi:adenosylcobyric acid synthase
VAGSMKKRRPIMVMGCTSDAGKTFLVTALCRHFANRGVRVAPFKAQNMSNNAAVTRAGAEIGRAQYLQALAARIEPEARMNPVLLKPSADTMSQVVVMGRVDEDITNTPWLERKEELWPIVRAALHELIDEFELVVIEGAGSPAEINLREREIVNMAIALECEADVYIASDIDRGGSFAHLLGTFMCLTEAERALVKGFVLNRFRGDPKLLGDAPAWLHEQTGVPVVALVPYTRHRLPEEDALRHRAAPSSGTLNLAVIAYPWASNLDEFDPLVYEDGVTVVPIRDREPLDRYDAVLLPGSKNSVASLRYLRASGLAAEVTRAASKGVPILGICGGMQILGTRILDSYSVEGGDDEGLGLLDVVTTMIPDKTVRQRTAQWIGGGEVHGYEIHHGRTEPGPSARPCLSGGLGFVQENVSGVYLHGLAENTAWRQRFLEGLGWRGATHDWRALLDAELDRVAQLVVSSGWADALAPTRDQ